MSTSDTDSEPEPVLATDAVSTLTAFAHLSATHPGQPSTGQWTVSWAVDTLVTLDFRLIRKDAALHGLIQSCASAILASFNTLLGPASNISCGFIRDIAIILRPSFLDLLFQYRRLFRVIATRDNKLSSAPLAVVCWVDVVLAKLGDIIAFVAAGHNSDHPDQLLPESLMAQREEDNLRAAIQLPDSWDMLPSVPLSERASAAAKRLSTRLMLGRYILSPALSGNTGKDNSVQRLLSKFSELVKQRAARVDELYSTLGSGMQYLLQQERLTSAMEISLLAAAASQYSTNSGHATGFRPQTMAAAMRLLRFVLNFGGETDILSPPDHLDVPTNVILQWDIVPQWTWSVWLECSTLHADTIMYLTTVYIQHYDAGTGSLLEVSEPMIFTSGSSDHTAMIGVMIALVFRIISVFSGAHSRLLSTSMMNALQRCCQMFSQWIKMDSCGIRRSKECCKALIILFGYLSQNEQHLALNGIVIECLVPMSDECVRDAWKAASEDNHFCVLEVLDQSFMQIKTALPRDDLPKSKEVCAVQVMQFMVIVMSKKVRPSNLDAFADLLEAVGKRVVEMPLNDREYLCEPLLICLATASLSKIDLPFSKTSVVVDDEVIWRLGMYSGGVNFFLASAFALYISCVSVKVEPLTCLEGLENLLDTALLICARHCHPENEALGLIVLPMICDALARLLEQDDTTGIYTWGNTRMSVLGDILRSMEEDLTCDGYNVLLRERLSSTARRRILREMDGEQEEGKTMGEYELVFCRLDSKSRLLYVKTV